MGGSRTDRVLLVAVGLLALAGLFDAWVIGEPDLVVLSTALLGFCAVLLVRTLSSRRPVRVRADLARWLSQRSDITGEPAERIADRALASYRVQLGEEPRRAGRTKGG